MNKDIKDQILTPREAYLKKVRETMDELDRLDAARKPSSAAVAAYRASDWFRKRQATTPSPRDTFLHPPAERVISLWQEPELPVVELDEAALRTEATYSSAIENLHDEKSIQDNLNALAVILDPTTPLCNRLILNAHQALIDEARLHPGRWRPYNVYVGNHIPPDKRHVPELMNVFEQFLNDDSLSRAFRAIYGHIYFETIHPFCDGNGRIGRAIVTRLLGQPWAERVYSDRPSYYHHLGQGSWDPWYTWMIESLQNYDKPLG